MFFLFISLLINKTACFSVIFEILLTTCAFFNNFSLYSFHMYEPYEFTSNKNYRDKNNYKYPGQVPFRNDTIYWDRKIIDKYFEPFIDWTMENEIPYNRIVAGEFGCMRKNQGADKYLQDVISFLNEQGFLWVFYSFREDAWDGYDYELETEPLGWKY